MVRRSDRSGRSKVATDGSAAMIVTAPEGSSQLEFVFEKGVRRDSVLADGREAEAVVRATDAQIVAATIDVCAEGPEHRFSEFILGGGDEKSREFLRGKLVDSKKTSLVEVVSGFDAFVVAWDLSESAFFQNEKIKIDFQKRLKDFVLYIEKQLEALEHTMRGSKDCSNFSEDWKENLRKASYYAFFIHYGAKRKGEKYTDADGLEQPKDYVRHVVGSAFKNLVGKSRFFCEQTIVAEIFHDVLEDWRKGIVSLLIIPEAATMDPADFALKNKGLDVKRDQLETEKKFDFEEYFQKVCDGFREVGKPYDAGDDTARIARLISESELVDIVTKVSDNKARALVGIFAKILAYRGEKRFSAARAIPMKINDRLYNAETFIKLLEVKNADGFQEMPISATSETIYIFVAIAVALKMWNLLDWLYDYLVFQNPEERRKRKALRQKSGVFGEGEDDKEALRDTFSHDFCGKLSKKAGRELVEGRDYILEFRPVGMRYESDEEAQALVASGAYEKGLQHYVIFRGLDLEHRDLYFFARDVFKEMLPEDLPPYWKKRKEFTSALGYHLGINRAGVSYDVNAYSKDYGVGFWAVFDTPESISEAILGYINRGYFYSDEAAAESRAQVLAFLEKIEPFVAHLTRQYKLIDVLRMTGDPSKIAGGISDEVDRVLDQEAPKKIVSDTQTRFLNLIENQVINKLAMLLIQDKPQPVNVVINGEERRINLPRFDIEAKDIDNVWMPLIFSAPWMAGFPAQFVSGAEAFKKAMRAKDDKPFAIDNAGIPRIVYTVEVHGQRQDDFYHQQTAFLDPLCKEYLVRLGGDDPSVREIVSKPPMAAVERRRKRRRGRR